MPSQSTQARRRTARGQERRGATRGTRIREAPSRSTRGSKASRKRWPTVPRRRRIEPATGACRAPPRAKRPAKSRCAILGSFHFHYLAFRRCEIPRLIHRLDTRGTYPEAARGHNLQEVDILRLRSPRIGLEERGAVVVEFAARIPRGPPRRTVLEGVEIIVLDELCTSRNGILDHQVAPIAAVDGEAHGENVAWRERTFERLKTINDLVVFAPGRELEIVTQDVERDCAGANKFFFGREVFRPNRPIQAVAALLADMEAHRTRGEVVGRNAQDRRCGSDDIG